MNFLYEQTLWERSSWDVHDQREVGSDGKADGQDAAEEVALPAQDAVLTPEEQARVLAAEYRDQMLRARADLENFRKQAEKEKDDCVKYSLFRFAKDIVVVADTLEQALKMMACKGDTDHSAVKALHEGVAMTLAEMHKIFKMYGIEKIDADGEKFDPHAHQVVMERDVAQVEPHTVVEVLQNGYRLHDRLVRPSMVVVASAASGTQAT